MALTTADYIATAVHTSDGETDTEYNFPDVDFINPTTDVEVRVGSEVKELTTDYTIESGGSTVTGNKIKFTVAGVPDNGVKFLIRRKTLRGSREVDFTQGSTHSESDLDKSTKQGIYLAEEAIDAAIKAEDTAIDMVLGSGNLPDPTAGIVGHMLQIAVEDSVNIWSQVPASGLDLTQLGTAAVLDTGTTVGKVPINVLPGGALGTAAYVDTGTADAEVSLNSSLGTVVTKDFGYAEGEVPTILSGEKIGPIKEITWESGYGFHQTTPSCQVQHKVANSAGAAEGKSAYGYGAIAKETWLKRPLTNVVEHNTSYSTGIELYDHAVRDIDEALTGKAITIPSGTWRVSWTTSWLRVCDVITRLYDVTNASSLIQGMSTHPHANEYVVLSSGSGVFTNVATIEMTLQFAVSDAMNVTQLDWMGDAFLAQIDGSYIDNIFATLDFIKEA